MRRWVSERAAQIAVWFYCFSGAALTFAWRATMPSFSDASLVAAGFGLLVWVLLATESSHRRRLWVGLVAFVALESAVFIRYTNLLELGVAVLGVAVLAPRSALRPSAFAVWGSSVAGLIVLIVGFDQWAYGSATSTGYSNGEITFSLASLWPNLKGMPSNLTTSMPMWLLAAAALTVIAARRWRHRTAARDDAVRTDARVATVLAGGWLGLWLTYFCYTWTVGQIAGGHANPGGGITVHLIRFYLPALGPMAMLAAWLVNRFVHAASIATVGVLVIAALFSFQAMTSGAGRGAVRPGGFGPGSTAPGGSRLGGIVARPGAGPPRGVSGIGSGGLRATPPSGARATG